LMLISDIKWMKELKYENLFYRGSFGW
jgi:hypothetical protein